MYLLEAEWTEGKADDLAAGGLDGPLDLELRFEATSIVLALDVDLR